MKIYFHFTHSLEIKN